MQLPKRPLSAAQFQWPTTRCGPPFTSKAQSDDGRGPALSPGFLLLGRDLVAYCHAFFHFGVMTPLAARILLMNCSVAASQEYCMASSRAFSREPDRAARQAVCRFSLSAPTRLSSPM